MTKHYSKAGSRLHKSKIQQRRLERRLRQQLKKGFSDQLFALEKALKQLGYSHCFYHHALINLLTSDDEPDSDTLIGAVITQRWLHESTQSLTRQLQLMQQQLHTE